MSLRVSCFALPGDAMGAIADPIIACDDMRIEEKLEGLAGIVLPTQTEERAAALLATGAKMVFIGEAALHDSGVIARLAARFGGERIGVYVPARRMESSWSFETVSNADFKVVAPSICEPCWEILRADGSPTATQAHWWIGEMMKQGASVALVRVDLCDDADLNLCAGLVQELGERLWLGPLAQTEPSLDEWVSYGKLTHVVLPTAMFAQPHQWLPATLTGSTLEIT